MESNKRLASELEEVLFRQPFRIIEVEKGTMNRVRNISDH
jgi:hypothetical protein